MRHSSAALSWLTRSLVLLVVAATPALAGTDLPTFCLGSAPTDLNLLAIYNAQCPAFLQSQFASANAANQAAPVTTDLAQQQSMLALYSSLAGLVKPPASQVASGTDISALAIVSQTKDADLTYALAQQIGAHLLAVTDSSHHALIDLGHQVLLVASAADRIALFANSVDANTVKLAADAYAKDAAAQTCTGPNRIAGVVGGVLAAEALGSIISTGASMFQPSLVAAAKTSGVTDPTQLMIAGLIVGLGPNSAFVRLQPPTVTDQNSVIVSVTALRKQILATGRELAQCPKDPGIAGKLQTVADAKAYLTSLVQTTNGAPSVLDIAARRAAITDSKIAYTLLLTRDVSGGGAAALKPNWFQSTQLMMTTADLITYQLATLEGIVADSSYVKAQWSDKCALDKWNQSFDSCKK